MNFFTITNTIFERGSTPLHGKVEILLLQSNVLAEIYSDPSKTIQIENPVRTNLDGMLSSQVFLKEDENYRIVYYKLIDESEEIYEQVREEVFLSPYLMLQTEANVTKTVETIAELEAISHPQPGEVFKVLNYWSGNDGLEPRLYRWFENSVVSADFGGVISSNSSATGRFHLLQNRNAPMKASTYGILPNSSQNLAANIQKFLQNSSPTKIFDIPGTYDLGIPIADFSSLTRLVSIEGAVSFTNDTSLIFPRLEVNGSGNIAKNMKVLEGSAKVSWWKSYSDAGVLKLDVNFTGHTLYFDVNLPLSTFTLTKSIENCDCIGIEESQFKGTFRKCSITSQQKPFVLADGLSNFVECYIETRACFETLTAQLNPWPSRRNTWVLNSLDSRKHVWEGNGPFEGLDSHVIYQSGPLPLLKTSADFPATPKHIENLAGAVGRIPANTSLSLIPFYRDYQGLLDVNLFTTSAKGEIALKAMAYRETSWKGITHSRGKQEEVSVQMWDIECLPVNLTVKDMNLVFIMGSNQAQQYFTPGKTTLIDSKFKTIGQLICNDFELKDSTWEVNYDSDFGTIDLYGNLFATDSRIYRGKPSGCSMNVSKITNLDRSHTDVVMKSFDVTLAKNSSFNLPYTISRQDYSIGAQTFFTNCVFNRNLVLDSHTNSTKFHFTVRGCRFNSSTDAEHILISQAGHTDNIYVVEDNVCTSGVGNLKQTKIHNVTFGGYIYNAVNASAHTWYETWGAGCETYDLPPNLLVVNHTSKTVLCNVNGIWWNTGASGTRPGWEAKRQSLDAYLLIKPNKMEINLMYDPDEEKYFKEGGTEKAWSKYALYNTDKLWGKFMFNTITLQYQ